MKKLKRQKRKNLKSPVRKNLLTLLVVTVVVGSTVGLIKAVNYAAPVAEPSPNTVQCPKGTQPFPGKPGHCTCPGKLPDDPTKITKAYDCGVPSDIGAGCTNGDSPDTCLKDPDGFIVKYLQPIVNVLSGLVAVVVIGTIIVGGIQYATAGGQSAEAAAKAKSRIGHGLIALAAYLLLFALIQWLIPGGIF